MKKPVLIQVVAAALCICAGGSHAAEYAPEQDAPSCSMKSAQERPSEVSALKWMLVKVEADKRRVASQATIYVLAGCPARMRWEGFGEKMDVSLQETGAGRVGIKGVYAGEGGDRAVDLNVVAAEYGDKEAWEGKAKPAAVLPAKNGAYELFLNRQNAGLE